MAEANDDMELEERFKNLKNLKERSEQDENEEGETSFIDEKYLNKSLPIIDRSNPEFVRPVEPSVLVRDKTSSRLKSKSSKGVPKVGFDVGSMRLSITVDKKNFISNRLGYKTNKGDRKDTKLLYEKLKITFDDN